jgi:serine/threonine protein kinase
MEEFKLKYEVERLLANGTFCSVFLVKERKKHQHHVVKYVQKLSSSSPACSSLQERSHKNHVKVLKKLQNYPHPNVCKIKEVFEDDASLLVVQEHVNGGTLLDWVCRSEHKKNREEKARKIFWKLLDAVEFLHNGLWIIHRDLKLENVLLDRNKEPKVIDFNLSTSWSKEKLINTEFCGSLLYCPPEILKKKPYRGPAQDVWSLGVLLYVLLYATFPFQPEEDETEENEENPLLFPFEDEEGADVHKKDQQKQELRVEIAKKIIEGKFSTPATISAPAINLLRSILVANPKRRPSINEIKAHPWFDSLRVEEKRVRSVSAKHSSCKTKENRERREKFSV